MPEHILPALRTLELEPELFSHLNIPDGTLKLRRSWPRSNEHLGLEYINDAGSVIPGQWFAQPAMLNRVVLETRKSAGSLIARCIVAQKGKLQLVLQSGGADRHLPALAEILAKPNSHLFVHRPERRAVVRVQEKDETVFYKLVRPERTAGLIESNRFVENMAGRAFDVPALLSSDPDKGLTRWSALSGTSLYAMTNSEEIVNAAYLAGKALRNLHELPVPDTIGHHSSDHEIGVIDRWHKLLNAYVPEWGEKLKPFLPRIAKNLTAGHTKAVILHRDFYDKQIFLNASGKIGLLDFDTLTTGEAALDLANALVHFELRGISGHFSTEAAYNATQALIRGYQPDAKTLERANIYAEASRFRLICVYAFRPDEAHNLPRFLARLLEPRIY